MQELNMMEIEEVSGGLSFDTGMGLIGGIVGVCAAVSIAPAAVAFGAGIMLGSFMVKAMAE